MDMFCIHSWYFWGWLFQIVFMFPTRRWCIWYIIPINFCFFWMSSKENQAVFTMEVLHPLGCFLTETEMIKIWTFISLEVAQSPTIFRTLNLLLQPRSYMSIPPRGSLGIDWNMWKPRSNSMQFIPSSWYQIPPRKLWIRIFWLFPGWD